MSKKIVAVLVCLALVAFAGMALAQQQQPKPAKPETPPTAPAPAKPVAPPVAGAQIIGISISELAEVIEGYSVKKKLMGQTVFNDKNQKVGKVDDLIISAKKTVVYAIIGAGGFLGIARHDVAIPFGQLKLEKDKIVLPGATKEAVKAMPPFLYAK